MHLYNYNILIMHNYFKYYNFSIISLVIMFSSILIGCLASKYEAYLLVEALFASWQFFKMAANECRFDVLYFWRN